MDKQIRSIIEDLLPLYNEGLLSEETTNWLEEQVKRNDDFQNLLKHTVEPLEKEAINTTIEHEKMMKRINRKLSIYQIIFVAISFFLAIKTSILNESFGFILWYAVLGLLTYLFYKDFKIVLYISLLPIFIWSLGSNLTDYQSGNIDDNQTFSVFFFMSMVGSLLLSLIHFIFALLGSMMGFLIIKIKERG
ncbi:hypothetical protein [Fredinandcohnia quinoae]|uniref:DUF1700 domain-containing protein n=1 Tax=Fredinandcohnia quinoae TaxID=2918902 RepID=A0AAW5DYB9_9BACI|nr:hypothetical protein [Fredinandcohnia sp. SECRCQ15]MCH1625635.1 hypothetical protein [Fredinandcohnia sp. SECRCQ15]